MCYLRAPTKVTAHDRDLLDVKMSILSPSDASTVVEELPLSWTCSAIFNPDSVSSQFHSASDPKVEFEPASITKNDYDPAGKLYEKIVCGKEDQ